MTEVSPMRLEMCCAMRSCGHSRCPNRIGGSYIEQLGTTRSQVISIDAIVQDGNRCPIPCPRPRPGDGRRKDRTRTDPKPKVHAIIHLVSMCHGPLLDGHPG
ncbi:UNVERIFIED_CONTAM: hypothetical protein Slati_4210600 [Sesamum latifolium]|uniref:Uncharacterized protein n=1 Tax=Sesamum latifolium TaxID=2727402 RepID=A0AAW2TB16_9LAMI